MLPLPALRWEAADFSRHYPLFRCLCPFQPFHRFQPPGRFILHISRSYPDSCTRLRQSDKFLIVVSPSRPPEPESSLPGVFSLHPPVSSVAVPLMNAFFLAGKIGLEILCRCRLPGNTFLYGRTSRHDLAENLAGIKSNVPAARPADAGYQPPHSRVPADCMPVHIR